jgi:hypothetical protein
MDRCHFRHDFAFIDADFRESRIEERDKLHGDPAFTAGPARGDYNASRGPGVPGREHFSTAGFSIPSDGSQEVLIRFNARVAELADAYA